MEGVEVVVATVVEEVMVGEVDISEDSLGDTADFLVDISEDSRDVDLPVDFLDIVHFLLVEDFPVVEPLVSVEGSVVEDIVNTRHTAVRGAIVGDTAGVMLRPSITEDTTTREAITEAIHDTIMVDMPHMAPPLAFSLAE
jgi:hypothetical protein